MFLKEDEEFNSLFFEVKEENSYAFHSFIINNELQEALRKFLNENHDKRDAKSVDSTLKP